MSSPEEIRDAVIREIEAAFNGVSREGGVSLHEADVIDNYGTQHERDVARALDTDSRWQEVPSGDIRTFHWILPFLDPIGFRYYLPAYMTWSLMNLRSPRDTTSIDATVFSLMRSPDVKLEEWELDRFRTFTPQQSRAICRFLRYMQAQRVLADEAAKALEQHWGRFCEP